MRKIGKLLVAFTLLALVIAGSTVTAASCVGCGWALGASPR